MTDPGSENGGNDETGSLDVDGAALDGEDPDDVAAAIRELAGRVREDPAALDAAGAVADAVGTAEDPRVVRAGARYFATAGLENPLALEPHADAVGGILRETNFRAVGDGVDGEAFRHDATRALRTLAAVSPGAVAPYADDLAGALAGGPGGHEEREVLLRTLRGILLEESDADCDGGTAADGRVSAHTVWPTPHAQAVLEHTDVVAETIAETPRRSTAEVAAAVLHAVAVVDPDAVAPHVDELLDVWERSTPGHADWRESLGALTVLAAHRPEAFGNRIEDVVDGTIDHVREHDAGAPREAAGLEAAMLADLAWARPTETADAAERLVPAARDAPDVAAGTVDSFVAATDVLDPAPTATFLRAVAAVARRSPGAVEPHAASVEELREATTDDRVVAAADDVLAALAD